MTLYTEKMYRGRNLPRYATLRMKFIQFFLVFKARNDFNQIIQSWLRQFLPFHFDLLT